MITTIADRTWAAGDGKPTRVAYGSDTFFLHASQELRRWAFRGRAGDVGEVASFFLLRPVQREASVFLAVPRRFSTSR